MYKLTNKCYIRRTFYKYITSNNCIMKGSDFMRKIIATVIISALSFALVGCQGKTENKDNVSKEISIESDDILNEENENTLNVEIIANGDSTSFSGMPINLIAKVTGEHNKDIQYHWILENDSDFEGFVVSTGGPQKEVVNLGDAVELALFAEVSWVEGAIMEFNVKLQVEEKETSKVIATDEITVENHGGIYKIK